MSNEKALQLPSNQKFGWFFAAIFATGGAYAIWQSSVLWASGLFIVSIIFTVVVVAIPDQLAPLNKFWYQFGMLLGRIVSPVVLGILFFLLITPVGVFTRFIGRDALHMKKRVVPSYWVERNPVGPQPDSFKNQF
jgi:hypothetical protein